MKLALALLFLASAASAQQLELTVKSGMTSFVERVPVPAQIQREIVSRDGRTRRNLIFQATLDGTKVSYQFELSAPDTKETVQAMSAVSLLPGTAVELFRCGAQSARLSMPGAAVQKTLNNISLTADLSAGGTGRCSVAIAPGNQSNLVVAPMPFGLSRKNVVLNYVVTEAGKDYAVEYQMEVQGAVVQDRARLERGKKQSMGRKGGASFWLTAAPAK